MPTAITSPDFFPAGKPAPPTPKVVHQEVNEDIFVYDEFSPSDLEVTRTDPSPPIAASQSQPRHHCHHRDSSTSADYGDSPKVRATDPSPAVQPTYTQIATRPRQCLSSSSSTSSHLLLSPGRIASRTRTRSHSIMPEHPKIYMPQSAVDPLPVLKDGGGLEENENLAISIVDGHNSWTVVQRKNKKKKKKYTLSEKWTKQQRENFERFGDIWYQEPYKNYHVSDFATLAVAAPQPQAQIQQ